MLNKQKGNMYDFVTHTWNAIKGKCSHDCEYCYMKRFPQKLININEGELNVNLGEGNFIFVGSSTDMFAEEVPEMWIRTVLGYCNQFGDNKYLFQTKNPGRIGELQKYIPPNSIIGTTIETNRIYNQMGNAPEPEIRAAQLFYLKQGGFETMITIEPIMDFDLDKLVKLIKLGRPTWVNIGADSQGHNLPEPSKEKIDKLIKELNKFTEVKKKNNLERLK